MSARFLRPSDLKRMASVHDTWATRAAERGDFAEAEHHEGCRARLMAAAAEAKRRGLAAQAERPAA